MTNRRFDRNSTLHRNDVFPLTITFADNGNTIIKKQEEKKQDSCDISLNTSHDFFNFLVIS